MTDESWYVVRNTPGVTGFVGSGNKPDPARWRTRSRRSSSRWGSRRRRSRSHFTKGQSVRVIDGPFAEFIGMVDEINPEKRQGQGAGQLLRPRDAGRARLPAGREALGATSEPLGHRGQEDPQADRQAADCRPARPRPAPPVGPALGQHGINIMEFVKELQRADRRPGAATIVPAEITVFEDRSFTFVTKTPPAADLLKKAAGVEKGSASPNRETGRHASPATSCARSPRPR